MGDHLPDKIAVDTVGGAGVFHFTGHGPYYFFRTGLITAQILFGIVDGVAGAQDGPHMRDAPGLLRDDPKRQILQRDVRGVS